jgi:phage portal protein BeeE
MCWRLDYFSLVKPLQGDSAESTRVPHILTVTFDKDKIEALAEEQDSLFDRLQKATFLTDNEKRLATGYQEVRKSLLF